MTPQCPDVRRVLSTLKDFQRDTVDYVFARMYEDTPPALRFLIADEVGLGKTLVARGVVARAVEKLWDTTERIDVVYICSNASIARQNINRLNITGQPDHRLPDRITLLPRDIKHLAKNKINFVSFTPGTSFQLKSSQGKASERQLLYRLLPDDWKQERAGAITALTGYSDRSRFEGGVDDFLRRYSIDEALQRTFHERLTGPAEPAVPGQPSLRDRFRDLARQLGRRTNLSDDEFSQRAAIVSELRSLLAAVCVESLEPDLVILDEFQRFGDLLHGGDEASALARQLFAFPRARVLLLSATPYKMYAVGEDESTTDHYSDLVQTIGFLQHDAERNQRFRDALGGYRKGLFQYSRDGGQLLRHQRDAVTRELRSVMVRTERLAVTADRSGMLDEMPASGIGIEAADLESFLRLQAMARRLVHSDVLEYWKAAPYLLNFMEDYKIKAAFAEAVGSDRSRDMARACQPSPGLLLAREDIDAFRPLDPANARLRALAADTLGSGLWRLTWLPPSLPYYRPEGEFAEVGLASPTKHPVSPTKRLVFSAWQVVPKVVAALLSYEAERLMLGDEAGQAGSFSPEARSRRGRLLDFTRSGDRLGGMPVLALLYPSVTLADEIDPLTWHVDSGGRGLSLTEALGRAKAQSEELLSMLGPGPEGGRVDEAWYWAAPLLLDKSRYPEASQSWWGQADLAGRWRNAPGTGEDDAPSDDEESPRDGAGVDRWSDHVEEARRLLRGELMLERRPDDLAEVMALLALSGPGTCALRALSRVTGGHHRTAEVELRNEAGWIAEGLRSLFNQPDVTKMLRHPQDAVPYWRRVLEYSARGGLQAVLDEYAHMLVEYHGLAGKSWRKIGTDVASEMASALRFRTANVLADIVHSDAEGVRLSKGGVRFRSRFAVRYGGRGTDEGSQAKREVSLRRAFNSPFWPFVLCSTSVGQEGLDFHLYCHAVVHWNLPSNPVDLEQREGRVHRYKGHAVRRNVAATHAAALTRDRIEELGDPWAVLFEDASLGAPDSASDLVPYWVYPIEGGARIERHVPLVPLSKDADRADALRRSLALYRMAFGQSRQEDLVRYLIAHIALEDVTRVSEELRVDLSPGLSPNRHASGVTPRPTEEDDVAAHIVPGPGLEGLRALLDDFGALVAISRPPTADEFGRLLEDFDAAGARAAKAGEQTT